MRALRTRRRPRRTGLTLMEIMLVLVILGILGSMAALFLKNTQRIALMKTTRAEIAVFETGMEQYQMFMNAYPNTQDGLRALIEPPSVNPEKWTGPYIKQNDLMDEWGNPYEYELENNGDLVIITSGGPDGSVGTADDISNRLLQNQQY